MKSSIWVIALLLSIAGCSIKAPVASVVEAPASTAASTSSTKSFGATVSKPAQPTEQPRQAAVESPIAPPIQREIPPMATQTRPPEVQAVAQMQQDYAATIPLPSTGNVTVRDDIRKLDPSRLLTNCPPDTAPYAFAESTHYQVQICSQEYDPWLPKYYIGQAKDGSGEIRITSNSPDEARQLIFRHEGYTYNIYRDSAHPEASNAYLQVMSPSGKGYAEALLYLYERSGMPKQ